MKNREMSAGTSGDSGRGVSARAPCVRGADPVFSTTLPKGPHRRRCGHAERGAGDGRHLPPTTPRLRTPGRTRPRSRARPSAKRRRPGSRTADHAIVLARTIPERSGGRSDAGQAKKRSSGPPPFFRSAALAPIPIVVKNMIIRLSGASRRTRSRQRRSCEDRGDPGEQEAATTGAGC